MNSESQQTIIEKLSQIQSNVENFNQFKVDVTQRFSKIDKKVLTLQRLAGDIINVNNNIKQKLMQENDGNDSDSEDQREDRQNPPLEIPMDNKLDLILNALLLSSNQYQEQKQNVTQISCEVQTISRELAAQRKFLQQKLGNNFSNENTVTSYKKINNDKIQQGPSSEFTQSKKNDNQNNSCDINKDSQFSFKSQGMQQSEDSQANSKVTDKNINREDAKSISQTKKASGGFNFARAINKKKEQVNVDTTNQDKAIEQDHSQKSCTDQSHKQDVKQLNPLKASGKNNQEIQKNQTDSKQALDDKSISDISKICKQFSSSSSSSSSSSELDSAHKKQKLNGFNAVNEKNVNNKEEVGNEVNHKAQINQDESSSNEDGNNEQDLTISRRDSDGDVNMMEDIQRDDSANCTDVNNNVMKIFQHQSQGNKGQNIKLEDNSFDEKLSKHLSSIKLDSKVDSKNEVQQGTSPLLMLGQDIMNVIFQKLGKRDLQSVFNTCTYLRDIIKASDSLIYKLYCDLFGKEEAQLVSRDLLPIRSLFTALSRKASLYGTFTQGKKNIQGYRLNMAGLTAQYFRQKDPKIKDTEFTAFQVCFSSHLACCVVRNIKAYYLVVVNCLENKLVASPVAVSYFLAKSLGTADHMTKYTLNFSQEHIILFPQKEFVKNSGDILIACYKLSSKSTEASNPRPNNTNPGSEACLEILNTTHKNIDQNSQFAYTLTLQFEVTHERFFKRVEKVCIPYVQKLVEAGQSRVGIEAEIENDMFMQQFGVDRNNQMPFQGQNSDSRLQLLQCQISEYKYKNQVMVKSNCSRKITDAQEYLSLLVSLQMGQVHTKVIVLVSLNKGFIKPMCIDDSQWEVAYGMELAHMQKQFYKQNCVQWYFSSMYGILCGCIDCRFFTVYDVLARKSIFSIDLTGFMGMMERDSSIVFGKQVNMAAAFRKLEEPPNYVQEDLSKFLHFNLKQYRTLVCKLDYTYLHEDLVDSSIPNSQKQMMTQNNFELFERQFGNDAKTTRKIIDLRNMKRHYNQDLLQKWVKDTETNESFTYGAKNQQTNKKSGQHFVIKIVTIKARILKEPCCGAMHIASQIYDITDIIIDHKCGQELVNKDLPLIIPDMSKTVGIKLGESNGNIVNIGKSSIIPRRGMAYLTKDNEIIFSDVDVTTSMDGALSFPNSPCNPISMGFQEFLNPSQSNQKNQGSLFNINFNTLNPFTNNIKDHIKIAVNHEASTDKIQIWRRDDKGKLIEIYNHHSPSIVPIKKSTHNNLLYEFSPYGLVIEFRKQDDKYNYIDNQVFVIHT